MNVLNSKYYHKYSEMDLYYVVIFGITQARGVKESCHFPKIHLFGGGCETKLKRWWGKQNTIPNIESASCLNYDFFDFNDYYDTRLDLIKW